MAGGMRRGASRSLADRVAASAPTPPVPPAPATLKHCWVSGPGGRLPGLLLGWRQGPDGWQGRVVHAVPEATGWVLVEEWLPAGALGPA